MVQNDLGAQGSSLMMEAAQVGVHSAVYGGRKEPRPCEGSWGSGGGMGD